MLEQIGYEPAMARWAAAADLALGRVVRVEQGLVGALTETGPVRTSIGGRLLADMARDPVNAPCAGDWAVLRTWPDDRSTVERILPRRTTVCCTTGGPAPHEHALCANVDVAAVVLPDDARPRRSARVLGLARTSGADVELLTRARDTADRLRALVDGHRTLAVLGLSARDTAVLVDELVGAPVLSARRRDRRGTAVRRQLIGLPGGGAVIDIGAARCTHCSHDLTPRTGEMGPHRR